METSVAGVITSWVGGRCATTASAAHFVGSKISLLVRLVKVSALACVGNVPVAGVTVAVNSGGGQVRTVSRDSTTAISVVCNDSVGINLQIVPWCIWNCAAFRHETITSIVSHLQCHLSAGVAIPAAPRCVALVRPITWLCLYRRVRAASHFHCFMRRPAL